MCNGIIHNMVEIARDDDDFESGFCLMWCKDCGALRKDTTIDGRVIRYGETRFPRLAVLEVSSSTTQEWDDLRGRS